MIIMYITIGFILDLFYILTDHTFEKLTKKNDGHNRLS